MIKRLFYFTGYRLSVLHYKGKELVGTSSFEPTDSGLDKFVTICYRHQIFQVNFWLM